MQPLLLLRGCGCCHYPAIIGALIHQPRTTAMIVDKSSHQSKVVDVTSNRPTALPQGHDMMQPLSFFYPRTLSTLALRSTLRDVYQIIHFKRSISCWVAESRAGVWIQVLCDECVEPLEMMMMQAQKGILELYQLKRIMSISGMQQLETRPKAIQSFALTATYKWSLPQKFYSNTSRTITQPLVPSSNLPPLTQTSRKLCIAIATSKNFCLCLTKCNTFGLSRAFKIEWTTHRSFLLSNLVT
jgi:hypothetical protein